MQELVDEHQQKRQAIQNEIPKKLQAAKPTIFNEGLEELKNQKLDSRKQSEARQKLLDEECKKNEEELRRNEEELRELETIRQSMFQAQAASASSSSSGSSARLGAQQQSPRQSAASTEGNRPNPNRAPSAGF